MNCFKKRSLLLFFFVLFFCAAHANAAYISTNRYEDTQTFDPNSRCDGTADWWHTIPADFNPVSAEISLELKIFTYSGIGILDLFSSDTNYFDYGHPYYASDKPGFIADLRAEGVPTMSTDSSWQAVTFSLNANQLGWLGNDGEINMALIGKQFIFPTGGWDAQFYLKSATITANAVPIPSGFFLLGSGLAYLIKIRSKFQS